MTSSELISRYYTAFNAKDWQTMLDCVSDTVRHHVNEGGERFGKEKFRAFLAHMDECYDEKLRDIVVMETPDGARAAAEFKVHGIYKKTDSGLPPANGQPYVLPAGAFFEIRNGLIERVTTYYNLQEWISQVSRRAEITLRAVSGEALEPLIPALAEMRIKVFAAYPYLYAGTAAYEQEYLRGFASAPDAVVVVATDPTGRVVGCATGSSLTGRHAEFSAPLAAAGYDLSSTFYFGESVLDPAWRSRAMYFLICGKDTHWTAAIRELAFAL
jgi:steroid delta-isomerase-like uncharacterized protein